MMTSMQSTITNQETAITRMQTTITNQNTKIKQMRGHLNQLQRDYRRIDDFPIKEFPEPQHQDQADYSRPTPPVQPPVQPLQLVQS